MELEMKSGFKRVIRVARTMRPGLPMIVGALLSGISTAALAATGDFSSLTSVTDIICTISNLISGPYLYGIGIILIVVGAIAIANSEGTLAKFFSIVLMGIGIAAAAIPIMRDHMKITVAC
jgi:TrbC/VIRB2 pilin